LGNDFTAVRVSLIPTSFSHLLRLIFNPTQYFLGNIRKQLRVKKVTYQIGWPVDGIQRRIFVHVHPCIFYSGVYFQ